MIGGGCGDDDGDIGEWVGEGGGDVITMVIILSERIYCERECVVMTTVMQARM